MEVSGQLYVPANLPRRKSPQYQLDKRVGGSHSRSGRGGERNKSHRCHCRKLNHGRSDTNIQTLGDLRIRDLSVFSLLIKANGRTPWTVGR